MTATVEKEKYVTIGKSVPRIDALEKVTGRAMYIDDLKFSDVLYGKILRSPHAHAKIKRIDTSKAEALLGVRAVVTGKDAPFRGGEAIRDQPFLAVGKVRCVGEVVAAVAADTKEIAEHAIGLIVVEYEPLAAVLDVMEAVKPSAPLIHEEMHAYAHMPVVTVVPHTNICAKFEFKQGDVEKGFRESDYVFEDTFRFPTGHHCQIEPFGAVAQVSVNGKITIWVANDAPHRLRKDIADAMGIPFENLRVICPPFMGGGFGGKGGLKVETVCIALAMHTNGRPVKIILDREEVFMASLMKHAAVATVKTGVKKDGKIVATHAKLYYDTGAYAEKGPTVTLHGCESGVGPYKVPNTLVEGYTVYTNNPVAGALRGYGLPQSSWAHESMIDMIADKLGIDQIEMRLKNALEEGSINPTRGDILTSVGLKECITKAAEAIEWNKPRPLNRGVGIACEYKATKTPSGSSAFVKVEQDGSASVITSAVEVGQGIKTILAQIASEELGIPMDRVIVTSPDTDYTPWDASTTASRATFHMGNAVRNAAKDAKVQILALAAAALSVSAEDLEVSNGEIRLKGGDKKMTVAEAIRGKWKSGLTVLGRGTYYPEIKGTMFSARSIFYMYAAQAVDLEVDPETGKIKVHKVAAAHDVGKALNPMAVEGQIEGGVVQGLGTGLWEEVLYDENGKMLNPNFRDYRVPTAVDAPEIIPIIVEATHEEGPFGAKGIGEMTLVSTPTAVGNAIYNATGIRLKELPATPERLLKYLKARSSRTEE
ncbi:MAG: xanthine dehydrogenase family protein molybdopterin-binding subunit [Candidatus Bathyarchaeia archaeon]